MAPYYENKSFIQDLKLHGKTVLIRVDFNVPLDKNLMITDNSRIIGALPTIEYALSQGAKVLLMSHLGRPDGQRINTLSLNPAAVELSRLIKHPVYLAPDCVGESVERLVNALGSGDVILLENLRFHSEETKNDPTFSQALARLCDVYINDAFGAAHRAHSSTTGIVTYVAQAGVGFLMKRELDYLGQALSSPLQPFVAILGGAKVSDKMKVIRSLMERVQVLLIGGGMACTFLKAQGHEIGDSLLESAYVDLAIELMESAQKKRVTLLLPLDGVIAQALDASAPTHVCRISDGIPKGWKMLDIGPETRRVFGLALENSKTICWNGPMGVFEIPSFAQGTQQMAQDVAKATQKGAVSIIGGGDSAAAIYQMNLQDQISHISTGGGASLEFLEGSELPGVAAIPAVSSLG